MSRYLLDTNVAVIAVSRPHLLSESVRSALLVGENFLSVVSYWEVVLKSMKGKLEVGDPKTWWAMSLEHLNAGSIALNANDVSPLVSLDPFHRDPFDRILIATAIFNDLTFLTTDREIQRYTVYGLKIVL